MSKASKTSSNLFERFYDSASEDEGSPTTKVQRKARKKLREIEALECKPLKTMEELEKINQKEYYQAIACPHEIALDTYPDKLSVKQKKEFKRNEQQLKKKIAAHEEKLREKKNIIRTLERQQRMLEEENAQLRDGISMLDYQLNRTTSSCVIGSAIRKEYEQLCKTKVRNKAWREIMLKYHSDKTKKVLGVELSNEIAKIATDLKPEG